MPFTDKWTTEEREEVCMHYILHGGNSKSASRKFKIPAQTIRGWTQTKWWADMHDDLLKRHKKKMDGKYTWLIDLASKEIADRLQNGDEIVTAKGERVRRKMSGKDLTYVTSILTDKRDVERLRGTIEQKKNVEQRLQEMQRKFATMATKKKAIDNGEVVELEQPQENNKATG
jgi:transposase-like protein